MPEGCAYLFANGQQMNVPAVRSLILSQRSQADFLIAVDGGLRFMRQLDLQPDLLIGDLNSLSTEEVDQARAEGVEVRRFPVHKDETDLELAVAAALQNGYQKITILGALGGRLDMTLGNIFLLMLPELAGCDVRLEDGFDEVFLIRPGSRSTLIRGQAGDIVSLLPLNGPAVGIRTSGLFYPLQGETLLQERTRGISNVLLSEEAEVSLSEGVLVCVHSRQVS